MQELASLRIIKTITIPEDVPSSPSRMLEILLRIHRTPYFIRLHARSDTLVAVVKREVQTQCQQELQKIAPVRPHTAAIRYRNHDLDDNRTLAFYGVSPTPSQSGVLQQDNWLFSKDELVLHYDGDKYREDIGRLNGGMKKLLTKLSRKKSSASALTSEKTDSSRKQSRLDQAEAFKSSGLARKLSASGRKHTNKSGSKQKELDRE